MFDSLIIQFVSLAGVAALIAALVNVGKVFGMIPDGKAQNVSATLSLAAFAIFVGLKLFAPEVNIDGLDAQAAQVAEAVLYILGFVVQIGLPGHVHRFLSKSEVPLLGYQHPIYFEG